MTNFRSIEEIKNHLLKMKKPNSKFELSSSDYIETLMSVSSDDGSEYNYYCISLLFSTIEKFEGSQEYIKLIDRLYKESYQFSNILSHIYFKLCMLEDVRKIPILTLSKIYITLSSRFYSNAINGQATTSDLNNAFSLCMGSSIINFEEIFEASLFLLSDLLDESLYAGDRQNFLNVISNNKSYLIHIEEKSSAYEEANKHFSSILNVI